MCTRSSSSCRCTLFGRSVCDVELHACHDRSGRVWGTVLHLTATTCRGCKGRGCLRTLGSYAGVAAPQQFSQPHSGARLSTSWHPNGLDESANGFKAVLQIQSRGTRWVLLAVQRWGKEEGCMRTGMKKSTSTLYSRNATADGCGTAFLGCCVCFWLRHCENRRHPKMGADLN